MKKNGCIFQNLAFTADSGVQQGPALLHFYLLSDLRDPEMESKMASPRVHCEAHRSTVGQTVLRRSTMSLYRNADRCGKYCEASTNYLRSRTPAGEWVCSSKHDSFLTTVHSDLLSTPKGKDKRKQQYALLRPSCRDSDSAQPHNAAP
uniref:Uncharacterized protein n=1 Tax=Mus spicilegus TaxID=10103 RepID=A0A8C6HB12_MUSSI